MIARIFVSGALIVLCAGFLWFAGNVIYLGLREFFKLKRPEPESSSSSSDDYAKLKT